MWHLERTLLSSMTSPGSSTDLEDISCLDTVVGGKYAFFSIWQKESEALKNCLLKSCFLMQLLLSISRVP